jgi:hypothetical protein
MMLLKVIMREGNMVWWISTILSFPSLCCKPWSGTCFIYPYLLLCASLIYVLTRFLCIGSGSDINVFHICFLMLSITLSPYMAHLLQALIWRPHEHLCKLLRLAQRRKKKHSWEITQCFIFSTFSFIWVLKVITTVITAPYPFYFVVVPREASNLSEVRFGDVAVLKLLSVLHCKNSWKFSVYLLDLRFLVHMPQIISKLSLVEHFLIWATENPSKI